MPTRALALASALLTLVIPMTATAEDHLRVQRFAADLSPAGASAVKAGGVVEGLWTGPDGGLTAAVRPERGAAVLLRLGADGQAARQPLEVQGALAGAAPRPDGGAVVLTEVELARVDAGGRVLARRSLPRATPGPEALAVGEAGVWQAFPDRLAHLALDGADASVKLPLFPPPKECTATPQPGACRWQLETGLLVPLRGGGCLVQEALVIEHDASGPNRTVQAALTILDTHGKVLAQALLGKVTSSLEWFNSGAGQNLAGAPGKFTLVRRAYQGQTMVKLVGARGDDLLVVVREGASTRLKRLGPKLEERWDRHVQDGSAPALSPAWTRGILLYSGNRWVEAFDEQGTPGARDTFEPSGYDPSELRSAIGQTPAGEWLLVSW